MAVYLRIDGLELEDVVEPSKPNGETPAQDLANRVFCDIHADYPDLYDTLEGVVPVVNAAAAARLEAADAGAGGDVDTAPLADVLEGVTDDMTDDVEYLLGLVAEALEDDDAFDDNHERAAWAVSAWCQELQYEPALRATGKQIPRGAQAQRGGD